MHNRLYFELATSGMAFFNENSYPDKSYSERPYRLLALFRLWNAANYFFPYKDITDENWDDVLARFIPKFFDYTDDRLHLLNCKMLVASLCDAHAWLKLHDYKPLSKDLFKRATLPVKLRHVDGKVVVWRVFSDSIELRAGDIILEVNGRKIDSILDSLRVYDNGATRAWSYNFSIESTVATKEAKKISVTYLRDGRRQTVSTNTILDDHGKISGLIYDTPIFPVMEKSCDLIADGVLYINLTKVYSSTVDSLMSNHGRKLKGVVIDLRGSTTPHPHKFNIYRQGRYFVADSIECFGRSSICNAKEPGLFYYVDTKFSDYKDAWSAINRKECFTGKLVVMVNDQTLSNAEFTAMGLQKAVDVVTIGSKTAGSDGNMGRFALPLADTASFSTIGICYPDGSPTQRVGVKIDEVVYPTPDGIRAGRDQVLERALEIINNKR